MSKGAQIRAMFDDIAPKYDLMNRLMTMGQDQKWRMEVVRQAGLSLTGEGATALDLATGTGDIAALIKKQYPHVQVTGGDFSENMLTHAAARFANRDIEWKWCDATDLPFPDESFNAVTFGYLLRNVQDVSQVLGQVFSKLRSGGRIVCLETTPPRRNLLYPFIQFYLKFAIPLLGRFIARDPQAYQYLTQSTLGFLSAEQLEKEFKKAGFVKTGFRTYMFRTIAIHWGEKP